MGGYFKSLLDQEGVAFESSPAPANEEILYSNNGIVTGNPNGLVLPTGETQLTSPDAAHSALLIIGDPASFVPMISANIAGGPDGGGFTIIDFGGGVLEMTLLPDGATGFEMQIQSPGGSVVIVATGSLAFNTPEMGFFDATPVAKPTVAGAKLPGDAVMASLLTALVNLGLIIDTTT